ncbi:MAG: intradiol ring-cleavage dioxygenase [Candidatus Tectomicrobia bacterium]|uniref:Intradiol ring-cleavage dioxygenase n=1 Tax=Tectimicrobiota bacterium TaxID=2528274 RepID=A0A938B541_UNCTE|nr:intradiol ring-cleavage dioxygenase [Candidatus Tectomicrobia bacterium]
MRNLNEHNITDEVLQRFADAPKARLQEIMRSLVKHLHAFAREVHLTEEEWFAGIQFATRVGQKCDAKRQEYILLSDTLGLSQLVVAQNHARPDGVTEQTVFGPFHLSGAPMLPHGANIAPGVAGEPCFVSAQVTSALGRPVPGATVDVWQADADGFYDVQHPEWHDMKLRAVFTTDIEGRFRLRTIKPCSYPVPTDGPVGEMMRALEQNPYRPAHLHVMIQAEGYDRLITHVFVDGDAYLDSDAVFGVRSSCIGQYVRHAPGVAPDGTQLDVPFYTLDYGFVLQPLA